MKGREITYPIVTDPLQPPPQYEAARDPAVGAVQVLFPEATFFHNQLDLEIPALAFDIVWTRHFRGDVVYQDGGLNGHGWDFAYNKRIVPIAARKLANGLFLEMAGVEKAAFWYYNGQGRAERYEERDSDERDVLNFDSRFRARVTTYLSPPGQFHEFERYILLPGEPHPFAGHPNVEDSERIFTVMREKNGTRYVFNCRGQLIHILSRNDSKAVPVRVTLYYLGPINPLTQNRMLTLIEDATKRKYVVQSVAINQGTYGTNYECRPSRGVEKIHRIARIVGGGLVVQYHYRSDSDPTLVAMTLTADAGGAPRRWEYEYDGNSQMTGYRDPNNCARGGTGPPTLANAYSGKRVTMQVLGGLKTLRIAGASVTDDAGTRVEHQTGSAGGFPVTVSRTVHPANRDHGGPWRTTFSHNRDSQVTEIRYPGGEATRFEYESANAPVTLGPIRDKPGMTYESDLARGNLLGVSRIPGPRGGPTLTSRQTYEPLYNQLVASTDAAGNTTTHAYGDYFTPSHRGNPTAVTYPAVVRPDGSAIPRPVHGYRYNRFGQREESDLGDGAVTRYAFDEHGLLAGMYFPGGGFERFERRGFGYVVKHETHAGVTEYERDGFGLVTRKIVDPGGLFVTTEFRHDANGNQVEIVQQVRDHLEGAPDLGDFAPQPEYRRTVYREFDALDRMTLEGFEGGGLRAESRFAYGRDGKLARIESPSLHGGSPHVTSIARDARGLPLRVVEGDGSDSWEATEQDYDDDGHPVALRTIQAGLGDADNPPRERRTRSTFEYDGLARMIAWTNPRGATTRVEYDALGNVVRQSVFGGPIELRRISYAYDAYRNLIRREAHSLDGAVDAALYHYSPQLRLERITSANGGETRFDYDAANRVVRVADPLGNVTQNEYDFAGRLVATKVHAAERRVDGSGRVVASSGVRATTMRYDTLGRVVSVKAGDRKEFSVYDSLGRLRASKSPTGQVATVRYDHLGRRAEVVGPLVEQRFRYTPGGLVSEVRGTGGNFAYRYDASGRLVRTEDLRTGAVSSVRFNGDDVIETDPNGTTIVTTVDGGGLPTRVVAQPAAGRARNGFDTLGGSRRENFHYDALGRLVEASNDRGSKLTFEYDGLGRVVEEQQTYAGRTETLRKAYAGDHSWTLTTYPAIAGSLRARHHVDRLGRVERVETDGRDAARFAWTGLDRVALREVGNGMRTGFTYDADERLVGMQVARAEPGRAAPRVLWAQSAQYDVDGPKLVTDTRFGAGGAGDTVAQSAFVRDRYGRITMSTTTANNVVGPGGAAAEEVSATTHRYDGQRLVETVSFDGIAGGRARAVRVDAFAYDSAGRVQRTQTTGGFDARVAAPSAFAARGAIASARASASGEQSFVHDANGNLVDDGRFRYAYDFRNRLVLVEDRRAPYGYRESARFDYDALGRRIAIHRLRDADVKPGHFANWQPPWLGGMTWLLYDGDNVVAEAVRNQSNTGPEPVLNARYVLGAAPGDIVRVERRPEADAGRPLVTLYVHGDVNGTVRDVSTADGRLHPVRQVDDQPGQPRGERAPGDAVMAGTTGVRMPYVGGRTRIDGFAGIAYRDDAAAAIRDYRMAHEFHIDANRDLFRVSITAAQQKGLIALGAMAAVGTVLGTAPAIYGAVAPVLAVTGEKSALGLAAGALFGGSVSFGVQYGFSVYAGQSMTRAEALSAFATGALYGMGGSVVNALGMGLVKTLGADLATSLAIGTALGVASGDNVAQAFNDNAIGSLADGAIGFGAGAFAGGVRAVTNRLARRGSTLAPQLPTNTPVAARAGLADTLHDSNVADVRVAPRADPAQPDPPGFVLSRQVQWTPELRALMWDILHNLDQGTDASREIARKLRNGELTVRIYSGRGTGGEVGTWLGFWTATDPKRIHLNIDLVEQASKRYISQGAAAVVVHEGIHAMGGGEISAHVGQGIFLYRLFKRRIGMVPRGVDLRDGDLPGLRPDHIAVLNAVRTNDMPHVMKWIAKTRKYGYERLRLHSYPVDPWVWNRGGWARALNIHDAFYDSLVDTWMHDVIHLGGDPTRRWGMF
jgi:YD repeat-containing protein